MCERMCEPEKLLQQLEPSEPCKASVMTKQSMSATPSNLHTQSMRHRSAHGRSALHCTCAWRARSTMYKCRSSGCSIGLRSVLGGRLSAVLMRARRALGMTELAGRDGLVSGPGCLTVTADRRRLLEQRGPSMEFAPR